MIEMSDNVLDISKRIDNSILEIKSSLKDKNLNIAIKNFERVLNVGRSYILMLGRGNGSYINYMNTIAVLQKSFSDILENAIHYYDALVGLVNKFIEIRNEITLANNLGKAIDLL